MGRQAYCNGASNHDRWRMEIGFVMTLPAAMSTIPAELSATSVGSREDHWGMQ